MENNNDPMNVRQPIDYILDFYSLQRNFIPELHTSRNPWIDMNTIMQMVQTIVPNTIAGTDTRKSSSIL